MANVSLNGAKIVYDFFGGLCETRSRVMGVARSNRQPADEISFWDAYVQHPKTCTSSKNLVRSSTRFNFKRQRNSFNTPAGEAHHVEGTAR